MNILIISDTHGRHGNLEKVLEKEKDLDLLIHLGDLEQGEDYIQALVNCKVEFVAGNNDYFSSLPYSKVLEIEGTKILITHGHTYYISVDTTMLEEEAKKLEVDIVMFGHTHIPMLEVKDNIVLLNPGSISLPRQSNKKPSYITMKLVENMLPKYEICYLD